MPDPTHIGPDPADGGQEEPPRLSDDAVVVRGGRLRFGNYQANAAVAAEWEGCWGLSVASAEGLTKTELAFAAQLQYDVIRVTTVGRLRTLEYDVVPTEEGRDRDHALILLPGEPSREDWEKLITAFDQPEPNPTQA